MTKKRLLIYVLAGMFCIALGAGGTLAVQKFVLKAPAAAATPAAVPEKDGPLVPIGEFMVNLQGGAFLKTSITVEGTDAKAEAVLKAKDVFMKDKVNAVLSSKSLADVQTPAAREKLRQDLIKELNDVTGQRVRNVLFLSMIYQ